tara:strand:- start:512 stop:1915 length:1404 start_codon:yes stop_codon:yes gene_type:complete
MIRFLSKIKKNKKVSLNETFPWLESIEKNKLEQKKESFSFRLKNFKKFDNYIKTDTWKNLLAEFKTGLIETGYPEYAADLEFELLTDLFNPDTINSIFSNPSNSFYKSIENGVFIDEQKFLENYKFMRSPKGLIFIVGSSNTILPVILAIILSYLCGNITVVQLSNLHQKVIPSFFNRLPHFKKNCIYFTNLNQAVDEDRDQLTQLVSTIKWDIINVWGGEEANDFYYSTSRNNKYRPKVLSMEPLTGVALIQAKYLEEKQETLAKDLAGAITIMGQQLCSSPTEGYIIGDTAEPLRKDFFVELVNKLEENYQFQNSAEANVIKLDRILTKAIDSGARVYTSQKYGNLISIINSDDQSFFKKTDSTINLSIHSRNNFLELINIDSFESAYETVSQISEKVTHDQIKKIQTILVFGDKDFWDEAINLAKIVGAYRVIDLNYVLKRHPLEPLDGIHLVEEFTYPIAILD